MTRHIWLTTSLFFLFLACTGRSGNYLADGRIPVTVEPVVVDSKQVELSFSVSLIPSDRAQIQLNQSSRVGQVFVNEGDLVQEGDPLFVIATADINVELASLRVSRTEQEALLEKTTYFLDNRDDLLADGKIDQTQYEGLEAEVQSVEAKLASIDSDIAMLERQLEQPSFTSPISGLVTRKNMSTNTTVPKGEVLLAIVQTNPIYASFDVPAKEAPLFGLDMPVTIEVEEIDQKVDGSIAYIAPELNAETKTFEVRVRLENPTGILKAGMTGVAIFTSPNRVRSTFVPIDAIENQQGRQFIYVVRGRRIERLRVFPKETETNLTEIPRGLTEIDFVIVKGWDQVKDGMSIELWK